MSSFPGHPPKAPEAPPVQRAYSIVVNGDVPDIVEADFITRDPGHICFWKTRPGTQQDTLVLAISNHMIDELKEVTP